MKKTGIHWFRRDLRLEDNTALEKLSQEVDEIIPVYIVEQPSGAQRWSGDFRQSLLCRNLACLNSELERFRSRLVVRHGQPSEALDQIVRETNAAVLSFNRDYDPAGKQSEKIVRQKLEASNVQVIETKDRIIHETSEVRTKAGKPFVVFSPFFQVWKSLPKPLPTGRISKFTTQQIATKDFPTPSLWKMSEMPVPTAGTTGAWQRLQQFSSQAITDYPTSRNHPDTPSSQISIDLRFGTISPRQVWHYLVELPDSDGKQAFLRQLAWREFFMHLLDNNPQVLNEEFDPKFRGTPWRHDDLALLRWKEGRTGFPIIDAAMRQLNSTGWMHNRARMIVSMFLTKDLHLDWKLGEEYFMQKLLDGEIACNNGGWQWSAGTGADAAPYFRIQNPWLQTKRFDRGGNYIKSWVPELRDVAPEQFWKPPTVPLAKDYPMPMVDHAVEKEVTMQMFWQQLGKIIPRA